MLGKYTYFTNTADVKNYIKIDNHISFEPVPRRTFFIRLKNEDMYYGDIRQINIYNYPDNGLVLRRINRDLYNVILRHQGHSEYINLITKDDDWNWFLIELRDDKMVIYTKETLNEVSYNGYPPQPTGIPLYIMGIGSSRGTLGWFDRMIIYEDLLSDYEKSRLINGDIPRRDKASLIIVPHIYGWRDMSKYNHQLNITNPNDLSRVKEVRGISGRFFDYNHFIYFPYNIMDYTKNWRFRFKLKDMSDKSHSVVLWGDYSYKQSGVYFWVNNVLNQFKFGTHRNSAVQIYSFPYYLRGGVATIDIIGDVDNGRIISTINGWKYIDDILYIPGNCSPGQNFYIGFHPFQKTIFEYFKAWNDGKLVIDIDFREPIIYNKASGGVQPVISSDEPIRVS